MALSKDDVIALCKRFDHLKSSRGNWESYWTELARLLIPAEDVVHSFLNRTPGAEMNLQIYDSSAMHYNELLASALHSMLTNPSGQWFELVTGVAELDSQKEVREDLQRLVRAIHDMLINTNFHTEADTFYRHLGAFGTAFMWIEEDDDDVMRFDTRPIFENYIVQDGRKVINGTFTPFKMRHRDALDMFGEAVFEDQAANMQKKLDDHIALVKVVLPRKNRDISKLNASNKPVGSYVIWPEKKKVIKESGYDSMPFAAARWSLASYEEYGRGPGMKTLPDNRMIQQMMVTTIRAAQKAIDPPVLVPDDGAMVPDLRPGGLNPYRAGTEDFVRPLLTNSRPDIGLDVMTDVRERIKAGFFIDQLQLRNGPQMTATEVNARLDESLRLFSPVLGRLEREFLQVVVARAISIMKKKNLLPEFTSDLADVALTVRFSSQIAKAQRMAETANIDRWLMGLGNVAQYSPEVITYFNPEGYVTYLSDAYGIPAELVRSKKEVAAIQQQQQEQAQQMQQQQAALTDSQVVKNIK